MVGKINSIPHAKPLIFTFDGLSRTASVKTEEQDSSQGKPATYIKGASLEKISLQILLSAELGVDVSREDPRSYTDC